MKKQEMIYNSQTSMIVLETGLELYQQDLKEKALIVNIPADKTMRCPLCQGGGEIIVGDPGCAIASCPNCEGIGYIEEYN